MAKQSFILTFQSQYTLSAYALMHLCTYAHKRISGERDAGN